MKQKLIDLIPPVMLAAVILFWMYGPQSLLASSWTVVAMSALIILTIQGLEFVAERHSGWRINRLEFVTDLGYTIFNATVIAWLTTHLADSPLASLKAYLGISMAWSGTLPFLVQVAMIFTLFEFGQYWMHRAMHNVTPFWLTHAPHHHITQLNAMKGAVGNPLELFLISLGVIALFEFKDSAIFCSFSCSAVISTFAHANVSANPPKFYSFFFTTIRNHSLHHSVPYEDTRVNYGNSLILLDRIFGTYKEGEASVVGQGDRKRLSIWEQTKFPFDPIVAAIRARRTAQTTGGSVA